MQGIVGAFPQQIS